MCEGFILRILDFGFLKMDVSSAFHRLWIVRMRKRSSKAVEARLRRRRDRGGEGIKEEEEEGSRVGVDR